MYGLRRCDAGTATSVGGGRCPHGPSVFWPPANSANGALEKSSATWELEHRVRQSFLAAHLFALRHIGIAVRGDSVALTGRVATYYSKQMASECARRVKGVVTIVNLIDVAAAPTSDDRF